MSAFWTATAVIGATGGRTTGDWVASGVSIDTRTLAPGDLFVALRGPNKDGHAFVRAALDLGAAAALVDEVPEGMEPDDPALVIVADTQAGLEGLGRAGRARAQARIAGVTGSVGKTTTKEMLRHALSRQAPTHASAASHNNHWGVPLSLARLPEHAAYGVFEMGMNHAGEISALTRQVRPHVALITVIAPAHIEYLGTIERIADAKAEIFEGLASGGTAVLNCDDEHYQRLRRHAERSAAGAIATYGADPAADWRLADATLGPAHSDVVVTRRGREIRYRFGSPGRHLVMNSLAVLATVEALGADPVLAARAFSDFRPAAGRGVHRAMQLAGGAATLIDESYNANPTSMRAALAVLGQVPGRRIAALGDMLELGEAAPGMHAGLTDAVEAADVAAVFTCGPLMANLQRALPEARRGAHAADSAALVPELRRALRPGDVLLVKGSLGSRMARVVEALTSTRATVA